MKKNSFSEEGGEEEEKKQDSVYEDSQREAAQYWTVSRGTALKQ